MGWVKRLFNSSEQTREHSNQARSLVKEVWEAHRDWQVAKLKLNEALGPDQVDYAIHIAEATEKRFNMLLREAKAQQLDVSEYGYQFPVARKNTIDM